MKLKKTSKNSGTTGKRDKKSLGEKTRPVSQKPRSADSVSLSKGSLVEADITDFDSDGCGVSRYGAYELRISGGLPGDKAVAVIDHVSRRIAFGHLKKLLNPSRTRSKHSLCGESHHCLGCPLITMKYADQLDWKRKLVKRHMEAYHDLSDVTVHPLLSPERLIGYRTTVKLAIAGKHSDPYIGIFRRFSHDVYDLEECPIHHPLINKAIKIVRQGISSLKIPIYNPRSEMGLLRYLVLRVSETDRKIMVVFVVSKRSFNELHHLSKYIRQRLPEADVIAQNVNSSAGNVIMGAADYFLTPKRHLTERVGDIRLMISPRSFFQVNQDGARLVYEKVRDWASLTGVETAFDLYCGIGGIALTLAGRALRVAGVEFSESAVDDARKNARLNSIENCEFEAGDASELLKELAEQIGQPHTVVLNPPRKGCDEQVLRQVAALAPRVILYVSCAPQTLARDLSILKTLGYDSHEIQLVDMFPQTMHVESIARLEGR